ncbi:nickel-dependent lactate racemase [Proteiniclasticum sp. SCR006]|uniref:Nickel-dependent lactate racemase n=1 Tax=Proteiniclasticum aestuarii TaxID=2817862 RepID=A0A939HAB1_9CLOT|nr:nickel-dependent lactate racemase [Proteiniclasticum aestuarii]MBO1265459.1 nickel-dependent lactate racemase [Proteiniclasticum aestuarii]
MTKIVLPYGKGTLNAEIPDERISAVMVSEMHHYVPEKSQVELVKEALENPIGTPKLREMAKGKNKVTIIASDHTRPVPSKIIMPLMLEEIRTGNPEAEITILISTGCHRGTTKDELVSKFGPEIVENENIYVHDCDDESMLTDIGILPSGGRMILNKIALEADLLVSEGFIEPHFFAGYSGGRKSVLPGVASRKTVMYNHNATFIDSDRARTGIIEGNPIHKDMLYAARAARLDFICNVVINSDKEVIYAVAGDADLAHIDGRNFLNSKCKVDAVPSDIVITTNGGYPLDQNIYQAVKCMTAAEATMNPGGVMIIGAKSNDGHGGEQFYKTFKEEKDVEKMMNEFLATPSEDTIPDQWQSQIFARILKNYKVIYISEAEDQIVRDLHMTPAHSIEEALEKAEEMIGNKEAKIAVIPDGVSVIVL